MDYLTSERPGTPNFKIDANFDMLISPMQKFSTGIQGVPTESWRPGLSENVVVFVAIIFWTGVMAAQSQRSLKGKTVSHFCLERNRDCTDIILDVFLWWIGDELMMLVSNHCAGKDKWALSTKRQWLEISADNLLRKRHTQNSCIWKRYILIWRKKKKLYSSQYQFQIKFRV